MEKRAALLAVGLAAAAPWLTGQGWVALPFAVAGAVACWSGFRRAGWLAGERRIVRVSWRAEGQWLLTDARGGDYEAVLQAGTRVTTGLVWLRWKTQAAGVDVGAMRAGREGGTRSMLLTLGDIPQSQLRRLGVRLRLAGCNSPASGVTGQPRAPAT